MMKVVKETAQAYVSAALYPWAYQFGLQTLKTRTAAVGG